MSQLLPTPANCGDACESPDVTQIAGPQGAAGVDGTNGANGVTAFSLTTAQFTQPAAAANVTVSVSNSTWMSVGQTVFVQNGGWYEVVSKPSNLSVTLENLGYPDNAAPTTVVANGQQVSPGGARGATGPTGSASYIDGSATLDFPSVAGGGGTQGRNITVVGAAVGDVVSMGPPATLNAGLVPYACVVTVDIVTIVVTNATAGALNPAAAVWKVRVHK